MAANTGYYLPQYVYINIYYHKIFIALSSFPMLFAYFTLLYVRVNCMRSLFVTFIIASGPFWPISDPPNRIDRHDYYCQSAWHTFITRLESPHGQRAGFVLSSNNIYIKTSSHRRRPVSRLVKPFVLMPSFTSISKHIGRRLYRSSSCMSFEENVFLCVRQMVCETEKWLE